MSNASSVNQWNLRMSAGSLQQWSFGIVTMDPGGVTPFPVSPSWEYVVRAQATDAGTPLVKITQQPSAAGVIQVGTGSVLVDVYGPATSALAPGTYAHALWQDPGTPLQVAAVTGELIVEPNPAA